MIRAASMPIIGASKVVSPASRIPIPAGTKNTIMLNIEIVMLAIIIPIDSVIPIVRIDAQNRTNETFAIIMARA